MAQTVKVTIVGDASSLENALNRATGSAGRFGKSFSGSVGQWIKGAVVFKGVNLALDGVTKALTGSWHAGIAAQEQTERLTKAFANQKSTMTATSPEVQRLEQNSRKLGFTNEDVRLSLTKLVNAGKSYKDAATEIGVAQDVARTKGIGLADATTALIKLQAGQTRAAKEYGIVLPPVTDAVDKLKAAHVDLTSEEGKHELALAKVQDKLATGQAYYDALTAKVQGQATVFSQSAAGGLAQFHAELANVQERLGEVAVKITAAVLPALEGLLGATSAVIGWMQQHKTIAEGLAIGLGALATAIIAVNTAIKIGAAASAAYNGVAAASAAALGLFRTAAVDATVAQEGLNVAMRANPYGLAITAAAALAVGIGVLVTHLRNSSSAFDQARTAATGYKSALDALRDATLGLTGAHLNVERAELTLERARANLTAITKTAGKGSLDYRDAQQAVREASFGLTTAQENLRKAIDADADAKKKSADATSRLKKEIGELADDNDKAKTSIQKLVDVGLLPASTAAKAASERSADFRAQLKDLATAAGGSATELGRATSAAAAFAAQLNSIPSYKKVVIDVVYQTSGSAPPGRATGGPVMPGQAYTVGEHGKEIFVPSMAGQIISNSGARSSGGGGGAQVIENHITLLLDNEVLWRGVQRHAIRYKTANGTTGF